MKPILRIKNDLYELIQDSETKLYVWIPVIGGVPLSVFVSVATAMDFARERVKSLGSDRAVLTLPERGENNL